MRKIKVFYDADALFSAFYSKTGAASEILKYKSVEFHTSRKCIREAEEALNIKYQKCFDKKFLDNFVVQENLGHEEDKSKKKYVLDEFDIHVIGSAVTIKTQFLITYNLKHYKIQKIEDELKIIITDPGNFLFYIRNILEN